MLFKKKFHIIHIAHSSLKYDVLAGIIIFDHMYFVRPLTAEEIAQRREALKQRLAEKKKEQTSEDNVSDSGELSTGNIDWLFVSNYWHCLKLFVCKSSALLSEFLIRLPCKLFSLEVGFYQSYWSAIVMTLLTVCMSVCLSVCNEVYCG